MLFLSDRHLFFNRLFEQTTHAVTREAHLSCRLKCFSPWWSSVMITLEVPSREQDKIASAGDKQTHTVSCWTNPKKYDPKKHVWTNWLQYMACQSYSLICWCALRSLTNVSKWWNQWNVYRIINTFAENVLEQIHRAMLVDKVKLWEPSGKTSDAILMSSLLYPPNRVILKTSSRFFALTGILP